MSDRPASFEERDKQDPAPVGVASAEAEQAPAYTTVSQPRLPESVTLDLQDLLDLPRQILPPQAYTHFQNALRETALTAYSLWQHWSKALQGESGQKIRKRIDIE
jgi:hypothetical protein